jgi:hypothetical protein
VVSLEGRLFGRPLNEQALNVAREPAANVCLWRKANIKLAPMNACFQG